jgi:hypothetical protein
MGETAPLLSTLTERLRGIYRLGVNDGAGLLDGKDTFTRDFGTTPIKSEAADRIEALEEALIDIARMADEAVNNNGGIVTIRRCEDIADAARAAIATPPVSEPKGEER